MAVQNNLLARLNKELPDGWEAKLTPDNGRIYYINHGSQISSWIPPTELWEPGNASMPYGWECAVDKNKKPYFINHVDKYTTRDDPRDDPDYVEPPKPRDIELVRDPQKGFGFVAGSEKPVVVRFVTDAGPSVEKLLPGDQIIRINGEDVKKAPREYVIDLVRSCKHTITLTVCQPYSDNTESQSTRKSALLTAAKKAKLKNNPSRVRFAESDTVHMMNGAPLQSPSSEESYVPFMPNVLKVFLENGQTKSFKYDNKTTVKDVMHSLQEKLNIKCIQHFNLVLQNLKSHIPGKMTLLQEHETLAEIAAKPGARHFRCLFRVMFVPRDAYDLLKEDPVAFEYFYVQCCNDVVHERFPEMKSDTVFKLAALQIQQHAMSKNVSGSKINIKAIEKECGMEKFVPGSIRDSMKSKDLRKILSQQMKLNQNLTAPGQKQLTALQAKLHYMKIVSELKTFGSRVFMVTLLDKKTEAMLLVGPKAGISLITNIKQYTLSMLTDFDSIERIKIAKEKDNMQRVEVNIKGEHNATLNLGLLREDAQNFVTIVEGYFKIFVDSNVDLVEKPASKQSGDPDVPPYLCKHRVLVSPWSYPEDIVSQVIETVNKDEISENERVIDLSWGPPAYEEDKEYIAKIKQELGIKTEDHTDEIISLTRETENNNETKDGFNKSVIVIENQPNTIKDYAKNNNRKLTAKNDEIESDVSEPKKQKTTIKIQHDDQDNITDTILHNGDIYSPAEFKVGDEWSDTDSGVESERKVMFGESFAESQGPDQESSDTDSWGTPTHSPAKADTDQSFGLHSPDHLPRTEDDFRVIASSFGLLSPDKIPPGIEDGILDARMFADRQIYIDPDIIDLTLLPPLPPPTDAPPGIVNYTTWHSSLQQTTSLPVNQDIRHLNGHYQDISTPMSPSNHPPFNRSASVGDNPDFFDLDIDAFIGKMTIPPPPPDSPINKSDGEDESVPSLLNTWNGPITLPPQVPIDKTLQSSSGSLTLDEKYASLVIPPPPGEASEQFDSLVIPPPPGTASESIEQIPIVPPVSSTEIETKKKKSRHRRSSSLDTAFLNKFNQGDNSPIDSSDSTANTKAVPPNSLNTHSTSPTEGKKLTPKDFESPATVSERLNFLLQSMPNFSCESVQKIQGQGHRPFRRTSSLRLTKGSSQELTESLNKYHTGSNSSLQNEQSCKQEVMTSAGSEPSVTNKPIQSSQEPQISSKYSRHLRRTHSFDVLPSREKSSDSDNVTVSTRTSSDAFSSLKAKLQSYKDFLLSRSNSSSKESKSTTASNSDKQQPGTFQRSSSFSFGWTRKKSKSPDSGKNKLERDKSPGESKENLSRGRSREKKMAEKLSKESATTNQEKKPQLMNTLSMLPKSTFRPHTSGTVQEKATIGPAILGNSLDQKSTKKTGPMKALSSVFANSDEQITTKEMEPRKSEKPVAGSVEKLRMNFMSDIPTSCDKKGSMDDMTLTETPSAKKLLDKNPFGTITGSMWRPTAMSSRSSIKDGDHETYKTFNNFDALRDMSNDKSKTESPVAPPRAKGRSRSAGRYPEGSQSLSIKIDKSPENSPQIKSRTSLKDSSKSTKSPRPPSAVQDNLGGHVSPVSKESFTLLKEKIHENHSDIVKEIITKAYKPENFNSAILDADNLLRELKQTMETLKDTRIERRAKQFGMCKDELMAQVKQFVYDAKLLVSNATGTKEKLAMNLEKSMHTLAKIFLHSQATMIMMKAVHQAQHLGFEVIKVTNSYKSTVNAAHAAVGKPLSDPHMKYLMRQATNLATLLSNLLKTLKTLEQS